MTLPNSPAVGDPATASWADQVAAALAAAVPSWTALTIVSGYSGVNSPNYTAAFYLNTFTGQLIMRGEIAKSSGNLATGATTLVTALPSAIRPASQVYFTCACSAGMQADVVITPAGALQVVVPTGTTTTYVQLDNVNYFIS